MRFWMMGTAATLMAATAGMAHGERESGKTWSDPHYSIAAAPLQQGKSKKVVGSCIVNPKNTEGGFFPADDAQRYYSLYEHRDISSIPPSNIRVLNAPQHGTLTYSENSPISGKPHYIYRPANGFVGKDTAEFLVTVGQESLRVVQTVVVFDYKVTSWDEAEQLCPQVGLRKISVTTPTLDNASLQSLLDATRINNLVTVTTADLSGSAVGKTTGSSITLDTTAAARKLEQLASDL